MWLTNPLDDVLSSRSKVAVLRVVCTSPVPLNGREIARRAAISSGNASKVLGELAASGVIVSRDQGRVKTYELAEAATPLLRRLSELFRDETDRQGEALDDLLRGIDDVQSVILFGSEARREGRADSDVDLLIVVAEQDEAKGDLVRSNALEVARRHLLPLSWLLVDGAKLREWEEEGNALWANIAREGICLRGTPAARLTKRWQRGESD